MLMSQDPNSIIEYSKAIPDWVWGGIIGVVGIIIGALLSWIPVILQLRHDAKERERERQMSLRRDVYLFATQKIGQLLGYLTDFYQTEEGLPEGYNEAIEQIRIIGSDETIVAINKFNDHMVDAFSELSPQKEEIRFLEERGKFVTSPELLKLKSIVEIQESLEKFKKVFAEKIKLTYELAGKCQQKTQLAEELLTPLVVAIRKELNTPFDEKAYRVMMKVSHSRWRENLEKYVASMKDSYEHGMQILLNDADVPELGTGTNDDTSHTGQ